MQNHKRERETREREPTYYINNGVTIGESSSGASREINPIWVVIGFSKGWKIVVVAIVNEGIPKYKHGWNQLSPISSTILSWYYQTPEEEEGQAAKPGHERERERED